METPAVYHQIIERLITENARVPFANSDVQLVPVFDRQRDHYLVMLVGWEGKKRKHGCLIHVDIIDGKFWIQRDGTEYGIATDLEAAGVPKDRIVLGFRDPKIRPYTGYAVA